MKERKYTLYNAEGEERKTKGSVLDILLELRGLIGQTRRIPPLDIINQIMSNGGVAAGMPGGCKWEPFVIDEYEYTQLVAHGVESHWVVEEYPEWIETANHFSVWQCYIELGVPWEEHKRLSDNSALAREALNQAIDNNEPDEVILKLHRENANATQDVDNYFIQCVEGNRKQ